MSMKALSLIQPYAALITAGKKTIETRSWKTAYRGNLLIHASAAKIPAESRNNKDLMALLGGEELEYGKILCSCRLVDCVLMTEAYVENIQTNNCREYICGIYAPGRYAWILEDVRPLETPIAAKGHLGLWNFEQI